MLASLIQKIFKGVIDLIYPLFKSFMPKQLFRYAFCGGFAVMVDITVFFVSYNFVFGKELVHFSNYVLQPHTAAFIVAFLCSFPVGFFLQKYITFTNSNLRGRVQLFRYILIVIICFLMNYYGIKTLVEQYHIFPTLAKMIVTVFVVAFSYFAQRHFSFKEQKKESL
jgi:putative flippase GtrA